MTDRVLDPQRALERVELSELPVLGVYKYQVISATPLGLDVMPVGSAPASVQRVPAGQIGATTLLTLIGQNVLVVFEGGDPSKPIVLSVSLTASMFLDSTVTAATGGPVSLTLPLVAPLVAP